MSLFQERRPARGPISGALTLGAGAVSGVVSSTEARGARKA